MEICYLLLRCCYISTYMTKWHNLGSNFHYQELIISEHGRKFHSDLTVLGTRTQCLQRVRTVKFLQLSNKAVGSQQGWRCVVQQTLCSLKISFDLLPQHINHEMEGKRYKLRLQQNLHVLKPFMSGEMTGDHRITGCAQLEGTHKDHQGLKLYLRYFHCTDAQKRAIQTTEQCMHPYVSQKRSVLIHQQLFSTDWVGIKDLVAQRFQRSPGFSLISGVLVAHSEH